MRTQRGSIMIVYAVVALAVASLAAFAGLSYNRAIARAETAEHERDTFKGAFETQRDAALELVAKQKLLDAQLADRRRRDQAQQQAERARDERLKKVYSVPEVQRWGDTPVPITLLRELRDEPPITPGPRGDAAGAATGGVVANDAAAGLAGSNDQRGPARLRPPASADRNAVQR